MSKGDKETPAKTNDELAAEYEAKINEYEAAQQARGRIFDPKLLMDRAEKIHEIVHPVLGLLRYGELTFEDSFEINKCKTDVEKTETVAWLMMSKAYPELPRDFLKKMPLIEGAALIEYLTKNPCFLSHQNTSRTGSTIASKPKTSP